jgi:hypothetical protein
MALFFMQPNREKFGHLIGFFLKSREINCREAGRARAAITEQICESDVADSEGPGRNSSSRTGIPKGAASDCACGCCWTGLNIREQWIVIAENFPRAVAWFVQNDHSENAGARRGRISRTSSIFGRHRRPVIARVSQCAITTADSPRELLLMAPRVPLSERQYRITSGSFDQIEELFCSSSSLIFAPFEMRSNLRLEFRSVLWIGVSWIQVLISVDSIGFRFTIIADSRSFRLDFHCVLTSAPSGRRRSLAPAGSHSLFLFTGFRNEYSGVV